MDQNSLMYTAKDVEDFLEHHGVKGQKWGVRRYQPYPTGQKPKGAKEIGQAKKVGKEKEKIVKQENEAKARAAKISAKTQKERAKQAAKNQKAKAKQQKQNQKQQAKSQQQPQTKPQQTQNQQSQPKVQKGNAAKLSGTDKLSKMSDDEIRAEITRMKLEKEYRDLFNARLPKKKESEGKKFVKDIMKKSGDNIGTQLTTYAMGAAVNSLAKGIFTDLEHDIVNPYQGQAARPNFGDSGSKPKVVKKKKK